MKSLVIALFCFLPLSSVQSLAGILVGSGTSYAIFDSSGNVVDYNPGGLSGPLRDLSIDATTGDSYFLLEPLTNLLTMNQRSSSGAFIGDFVLNNPFPISSSFDLEVHGGQVVVASGTNYGIFDSSGNVVDYNPGGLSGPLRDLSIDATTGDLYFLLEPSTNLLTVNQRSSSGAFIGDFVLNNPFPISSSFDLEVHGGQVVVASGTNYGIFDSSGNVVDYNPGGLSGPLRDLSIDATTGDLYFLLEPSTNLLTVNQRSSSGAFIGDFVLNNPFPISSSFDLEVTTAVPEPSTLLPVGTLLLVALIMHRKQIRSRRRSNESLAAGA